MNDIVLEDAKMNFNDIVDTQFALQLICIVLTISW